MFVRSFFLTIILLPMSFVASTPAFAKIPWPSWIYMESVCDGENRVLRIVADSPGEDMTINVRRTSCDPSLAGAVVLATGLVLPAKIYGLEFLVADPDLGPADTGFYEVELVDSDNETYWASTDQLSCAADPYIMSGYLMSDSSFLPCTNSSRFECDTVELLLGDMNQHINTGELLNIFGWVQNSTACDDCSVLVTRIDPLGQEADCVEEVATTKQTWGAMKATFR